MEYNKIVIELFCHFLQCAEPRIREVRRDTKRVLSQHDGAIGSLGGSSFVAYVDGDMAHVFNQIDVDPVKQLKDIRLKAKRHLKEARNAVTAERRYYACR